MKISTPWWLDSHSDFEPKHRRAASERPEVVSSVAVWNEFDSRFVHILTILDSQHAELVRKLNCT